MDKYTRYLVAIVLLLSVGTLTSVLILLWTMPDIPEQVAPGKMCLPKLSDTMILLPELNCGSVSTGMHIYLQMKFQKTTDHLLYMEQNEQDEIKASNKIQLKTYIQQNYWEVKPAARFTGKMLEDSIKHDSSKDLDTIREWSHGRNLWSKGGFKRYGMQYINGRIVVPLAGTYTIYSFVDLYEPCLPDTGIPNVEDGNQSIEHAIFKFNLLDGVESKILSGVQPHLKSQNKYFNIYGSYISSIFNLDAGDEISVKVSNITYLRYPDANYFGLNLI